MERENIGQSMAALGQQVIGYWIESWTANAAYNAQFLCDNFGKQVNSIHEIPKPLGTPALIVGSGPSLDKFPFNDFAPICHEWAVFCSMSNVGVFLRHGITPDYVVAVDSALLTGKKYLTNETAELLKRSTLLVPPTIHPNIIHKWKGPIRIFKPVQIGVPFIMDTLPKMYVKTVEDKAARNRQHIQLFPVGFANAGCVGNTAIECASYISHEPIFLTGIDFGFPGRLPGCTRWHIKNNEWSSEDQPIGSYRTMEAPRLSVNGIWTTAEQLHYKINLYIIWNSIKCRLYNLNPNSIMGDAVPLADPKYAFHNWKTLWENYPIPEEKLDQHCKSLCMKMGMKPGQAEDATVNNPPSITTAPTISALPAQGNIDPATGFSKGATIKMVQTFESLPPEIQAQLKAQGQGPVAGIQK